jgi:hypothetical protein
MTVQEYMAKARFMHPMRMDSRRLPFRNALMIWILASLALWGFVVIPLLLWLVKVGSWIG